MPTQPMYPEAHQRGSWKNPISKDWGSATNNPMCGYWQDVIIKNNPPAPYFDVDIYKKSITVES